MNRLDAVADRTVLGGKSRDRRPEGPIVEFFRGERKDAEQVALRLFGRRLALGEFAGLAGALDGARVDVGTLDGLLYIELSGPRHESYRTFLWIGRRQRALVLTNGGFHILWRCQRDRGLGLRVFARQVDSGRRLGIDRIETFAARRRGENGYYTWPRFGFDGPLPPAIQETLPPKLRPASRVLDLMEAEDGRTWWKEHGTRMFLRFNLADGSRSWEVFRRYLREQAGRSPRHKVACGLL
jgi:hypothetical protein